MPFKNNARICDNVGGQNRVTYHESRFRRIAVNIVVVVARVLLKTAFVVFLAASKEKIK